MTSTLCSLVDRLSLIIGELIAPPVIFLAGIQRDGKRLVILQIFVVRLGAGFTTKARRREESPSFLVCGSAPVCSSVFLGGFIFCNFTQTKIPVVSRDQNAGFRSSVIVFRRRADSRAASRISVTIMLLSSEEGPDGFRFPRTTPIRYESESRSSGGNGSGVRASSRLPGSRTRTALPPVAMAYPPSP